MGSVEIKKEKIETKPCGFEVIVDEIFEGYIFFNGDISSTLIDYMFRENKYGCTDKHLGEILARYGYIKSDMTPLKSLFKE